MLADHLYTQLKQYLGHPPTKSQEDVLGKLAAFTIHPDNDKLFLIKGYAGTGKTTIVRSLVYFFKEIKRSCVLLAPTGRAAKVLNSYTQYPAYTIHKKIYRQKSSKDGFGEFVLNKNLYKNAFFIVDEASMISNASAEISIFGSGKLLEDMIEFVYTGENCKLIIIGDTAQLPPVGIDLSPALDKRILQKMGLDVVETFLDEVIRQEVSSGILANATHVRNMVMKKMKGEYPQLLLAGYTDIKLISGVYLLDLITDSYDQYGIENVVIICRSNKRANAYNAGIRNQVLWREEEISVGDTIMVVKNNYYWSQQYEDSGLDFIANGDIAVIQRIYKIQDLYGYRFAEVELEFVDYDGVRMDVQIILNTITSESAALSSEENKQLFYTVLEDYQDVKSKRKQYDEVRNNPYFNALQVKFAYAITCHKAQGGQWHTVFIDQGYLTDEMMNTEYLRWLYTAITRATKQLYLVNFKKDFFMDTDVDY